MTTPFLREDGKPRPKGPRGTGPHKHRRWRLSGHKKAHIDSVRNDINVTPLVDVMLVLLIIFMLMTLIMGRGADVDVAKAHYPSEEKDKDQPIVSMDVEGNLWVEKEKLGAVTPGTLKEMADRVRQGWEKHPDVKNHMFFKADSKLAYGKAYPVLMFIHEELGLDSVNLAAAKADVGAK